MCNAEVKARWPLVSKTESFHLVFIGDVPPFGSWLTMRKALEVMIDYGLPPFWNFLKRLSWNLLGLVSKWQSIHRNCQKRSCFQLLSFKAHVLCPYISFIGNNTSSEILILLQNILRFNHIVDRSVLMCQCGEWGIMLMHHGLLWCRVDALLVP